MTTIDVRNPRSGQVDYQVEAVSAAQISGIAKSMRAAQGAWHSAGIEHRIDTMGAWRDALKKHAHAIGEALCVDTGRRMMAHWEVQGVIGSIERWCELAPQYIKADKPTVSASAPSVNFHHHLVPYNIVGVISPWNFPMTLALIDTVPALLSGASVLLKPSEVTPRFIEPLKAALDEVPELNEVFKIVTGGPETGMALIDNANAVCFTGSVDTGRKVAMQAAQNFIPAFLELGGKDPAIVLASADLDNATNAILRGSASMTGQACQSLERVYVHESIYDEFLGMLINKAEQANYNWPDLNVGQLGPLIFAPQAETITRQLEDAVAKGATIHCGGKVEHHDGGAWIAPTVVSKVTHDMSLMNDETFGPIMPVMSFAGTEEAIKLANDSVFGLSGAVFAGDTAEAETIGVQINVGAVSINDASLTAFVNDAEKHSFQLSGLGGSRMGPSGFTRFLRKRAMLVQTAPAMPIQALSEGQ